MVLFLPENTVLMFISLQIRLGIPERFEA